MIKIKTIPPRFERNISKHNHFLNRLINKYGITMNHDLEDVPFIYKRDNNQIESSPHPYFIEKIYNLYFLMNNSESIHLNQHSHLKRDNRFLYNYLIRKNRILSLPNNKVIMQPFINRVANSLHPLVNYDSKGNTTIVRKDRDIHELKYDEKQSAKLQNHHYLSNFILSNQKKQNSFFIFKNNEIFSRETTNIVQANRLNEEQINFYYKIFEREPQQQHFEFAHLNKDGHRLFEVEETNLSTSTRLHWDKKLMNGVFFTDIIAKSQDLYNQSLEVSKTFLFFQKDIAKKLVTPFSSSPKYLTNQSKFTDLVIPTNFSFLQYVYRLFSTSQRYGINFTLANGGNTIERYQYVNDIEIVKEWSQHHLINKDTFIIDNSKKWVPALIKVLIRNNNQQEMTKNFLNLNNTQTMMVLSQGFEIDKFNKIYSSHKPSTEIYKHANNSLQYLFALINNIENNQKQFIDGTQNIKESVLNSKGSQLNQVTPIFHNKWVKSNTNNPTTTINNPIFYRQIDYLFKKYETNEKLLKKRQAQFFSLFHFRKIDVDNRVENKSVSWKNFNLSWLQESLQIINILENKAVNKRHFITSKVKSILDKKYSYNTELVERYNINSPLIERTIFNQSIEVLPFIDKLHTLNNIGKMQHVNDFTQQSKKIFHNRWNYKTLQQTKQINKQLQNSDFKKALQSIFKLQNVNEFKQELSKTIVIHQWNKEAISKYLNSNQHELQNIALFINAFYKRNHLHFVNNLKHLPNSGLHKVIKERTKGNAFNAYNLQQHFLNNTIANVIQWTAKPNTEPYQTSSGSGKVMFIDNYEVNKPLVNTHSRLQPSTNETVLTNSMLVNPMQVKIIHDLYKKVKLYKDISNNNQKRSMNLFYFLSLLKGNRSAIQKEDFGQKNKSSLLLSNRHYLFLPEKNKPIFDITNKIIERITKYNSKGSKNLNLYSLRNQFTRITDFHRLTEYDKHLFLSLTGNQQATLQKSDTMTRFNRNGTAATDQQYITYLNVNRENRKEPPTYSGLYTKPLRMDFYQPNQAKEKNRTKPAISSKSIHAIKLKDKEEHEETIANYVNQNLHQIVDKVYSQLERKFKFERQRKGF